MLSHLQQCQMTLERPRYDMFFDERSSHDLWYHTLQLLQQTPSCDQVTGISHVPHGKMDLFPGPGFNWISPDSSIRRMARHRLSVPSWGLGECIPVSRFTVSANVKFLTWVAVKVIAVLAVLLERKGCWS